MSLKKEKGYSLIAIVMLLLISAMLMLNSLNKRLVEQVTLFGDDKRYIQFNQQAYISLAWGLAQKWSIPTKVWQCQQSPYQITSQIDGEQLHTVKMHACIKLTSSENVALIKGISEVMENEQVITMFRWVTLPDEWQHSSQIYVSKRAHGWLDFCPESQEKECF